MTDVEGVIKSAFDIYELIGSGAKDFGQLLTDVENMVNDVEVAATDCRKSYIIPRGPVQCAEDMEKIEQAAAKLIKDTVARNFQAALQDLEDIEAAAKAGEADCKLRDAPVKVTGAVECAKDLENMEAASA